VDANTKVQLSRALRDLTRKLNQTIVYVTHDQTEAMTLADQIVLMKAGEIVQRDAPRDLYNRPNDKFGGWFLGNPGMNFFDVALTQTGNQAQIVMPLFPAPLSISDLPEGVQHQKLTLGIRPEHIRVGTEPSTGAVSGRVVRSSIVVGGQYLLAIQVGQQMLKAKVPGTRPYQSGGRRAGRMRSGDCHPVWRGRTAARSGVNYREKQASSARQRRVSSTPPGDWFGKQGSAGDYRQVFPLSLFTGERGRVNKMSSYQQLSFVRETMTYIFNAPTAFKEEMIEGYTAAYSRYLQRVPGASAVRAVAAPRQGKVSIVVGGGSGHYPAFCGLVGRGMADGAVIGDVFASPSAEQVYRCTKAVNGGAGVVYVCVNYSGDVMNFGMAADRCRAEGIDIRMTLVTDDVASAPPDQIEDRRGIAGGLYVFKAAGASAERGDSVDEVERIARHANDMTRSFGLAFAGCTIPGQAAPLFTVGPKQMEVGLGIHGEPGIRTAPLLPACELAQLMVETVLADVPAGAGKRAAVLLNGLGSTKYEELFVLYGSIHQQLTVAGLDLYQPLIAEAVTSLDMAGCSLSLMWLDDELETLLNAPASTPAYTKIGVNGHA